MPQPSSKKPDTRRTCRGSGSLLHRRHGPPFKVHNGTLVAWYVLYLSCLLPCSTLCDKELLDKPSRHHSPEPANLPLIVPAHHHRPLSRRRLSFHALCLPHRTWPQPDHIHLRPIPHRQPGLRKLPRLLPPAFSRAGLSGSRIRTMAFRRRSRRQWATSTIRRSFGNWTHLALYFPSGLDGNDY